MIVTIFDYISGSNQFTNIMETFIYLNKCNQVVYCDVIDSYINLNNTQLRRYVIKVNLLNIFVKYYSLRLHPEALKHVTTTPIIY
jgi:hypothetical protein